MKTIRTNLSTAKDIGRVFYEKETFRLENFKSQIKVKLILSQLARLLIFQIWAPSILSPTSQIPQDYLKSLKIVKGKVRLQPQMSSETQFRL